MSLAQSDKNQGQSKENSGSSMRVIIEFHLQQNHHSLWNDLMHFDSGFCFTLQVVKSGSEKFLSCKILPGENGDKNTVSLDLLASCVPAEVEHTPLQLTLQKVNSCGVPWLTSHPCPWKLPALRASYREGRRRGIAGSACCSPGKCWSPLGTQELARPFLH